MDLEQNFTSDSTVDHLSDVRNSGCVDLLVVVPIYNEERILFERLTSLYEYLSRSVDSFLIVLSVDDSGDKSVDIAKSFSKNNSNIEVIIHKQKKGRGFAVREAWQKFPANFYSFIDTDLATGVNVISTSLDVLKTGKYDAATASRYCSGASVERPPLRNAISRIYNYGLRILFQEKLNDHQCGYKIINNRIKEQILNKTEINSWFWDAELLVKSIKFGFNVKEIPVVWVEKKYKNTSIKRLAKDIGIHGYGILRLIRDVRAIDYEKQTIKNEDVNVYY